MRRTGKLDFAWGRVALALIVRVLLRGVGAPGYRAAPGDSIRVEVPGPRQANCVIERCNYRVWRRLAPPT
uniref:Uncharacterized protein n=1 Tax=Ectopseudomonas oleovorans TaxID=301 RepID=A0A653BAV8_ECTOL